jgi:hypothetical protein
MNDADLAAAAASSAVAVAGFTPVPDCAVVHPHSPVVADVSGLSRGDVRFPYFIVLLLDAKLNFLLMLSCAFFSIIL